MLYISSIRHIFIIRACIYNIKRQWRCCLFTLVHACLQYLSQCVVGASLEEIEEEEEDNESVSSDIIPVAKDGCYDIIGTLKDRTNPKPDFVKEIIQVTFIHGLLKVYTFVSDLYIHIHIYTGIYDYAINQFLHIHSLFPWQYETKEQLYEHMIECDIIVYDITEDPDQIDEAIWAVSGKEKT